ncbi:MAG: hypothetical protein JWN95_3876 [Frankiales bacterium]|nr:hypothetical protein [Frankiales bacterium]
MSIDPTEAVAEPAGRPRTVDYALYAIVAQVALAVIFALSLVTARGYFIKSWRKDGLNADSAYHGWSDQRLHDHFPSVVKTSIITAVLFAVLVLLIAKYIRDGKNWARWLYIVLTVFPLSPMADAYRFIGAFVGYPPLQAVVSFLVSVAAIAAVVFLLVRPSWPYFRRNASTTPSPGGPISFRGMFAPRPPANPDSTEPARTSPRAKSRRNPAE